MQIACQFALIEQLGSNSSKVQINLNKCIDKYCNSEAIAIAPCERNLYKTNFVKMHEAKATNYVQSPTEDDTLELWHRSLIQLNVKGVRTLQKIISDTNIGKFSCLTSSLFCEMYIEGKQLRVAFSNKKGGKQQSL